MERLTVKRPDGRWAIANSDNASPTEQVMKIPAVIDRLAAYEDTGLEPEQAAALKAYTERKAVMMVTEIDGMPIDRVRELVAAEQQGRGTGCEWCNSIGKRLEDFEIGDLMARSVVEHTYWGAGDWHQQQIRFCPICGKKLEGGAANA